MRNKILSTAAALVIGTALSTSMAHSADLDPVMEAYNWSGSYFGVKLGGGFGDGRVSDHDFPGGTSTGPYNIDGFIGGIMSGYNFQSGNVVFGLDSDLSFADVDGRGSFTAGPAPTKVELETLSTTRLRAGWAMDRVLFYATAGLATGYVDATAISGGVARTGKSELHLGFAAGGGVEWAFMDGWHARLEYLFVDLEKKSHNFGGNAGRVSVNDLHVVRAGVSMKTGWIWDSIMGAR